MRYHYEKPEIYLSKYGKTHICDHPVYDRCTLFEIDGTELAVIQQRFDPQTKSTSWSNIDDSLTDEIYLHPNFRKFLKNLERQHSNGKLTTGQNGLPVTVTVRQLMWALRMKPLKRERWETVFDRKEI